MAATLAGVCQVPLTAVLLLFELTQDYRIVLPLLGAVGLSSLIASGQTREKDVPDKTSSKDNSPEKRKRSFSAPNMSSDSSNLAEEASNMNDLCELESSLCMDDSLTDLNILEARVSVSQAMRTNYVTVIMSTLLIDAVSLMLTEKQSCAFIVDHDNFLLGCVTLGDIQEVCKIERGSNNLPKVFCV